MNNIFWPQVDSTEDAKKACGNAAGFAFFMAIATAAMMYFSLQGKADFLKGLVSAESYIDVVLLTLLGFGVSLRSRIASVLLLIYAIANRVIIAQTVGVSGITSGIVQVLFFIGGVRGAFAYHRIRAWERKQEQQDEAAGVSSKLFSEPPAQNLESPKSKLKKSVVLMNAMIFLTIIVVAVCGVIFFLNKSQKKFAAESDAGKLKVPTESEVAKILSEQDSQLAASGDQRRFKLITGESVSGKVVVDDPVYFTLETAGGGQKIVVKEDIQEEL